jgi:hypothetical protein
MANLIYLNPMQWQGSATSLKTLDSKGPFCVSTVSILCRGDGWCPWDMSSQTAPTGPGEKPTVAFRGLSCIIIVSIVRG